MVGGSWRCHLRNPEIKYTRAGVGTYYGQGQQVFLHVFDWPEDHQLSVSGVKADHIKKAFLLHDDKPALKLLGREMDLLLPSGLASHSIEA